MTSRHVKRFLISFPNFVLRLFLFMEGLYVLGKLLSKYTPLSLSICYCEMRISATTQFCVDICSHVCIYISIYLMRFDSLLT